MRRLVIGGAIAGALALAPGDAAAAVKDGVRYDLGYSQKSVQRSTGFTTLIDSRATADASGRPRAARKVTITFHRGTRFDTRVRPACTAATLRAEGPAGCPRGSRVGTGEAEAVIGLSAIDPVGLTVEAFNARSAILFYVRSKPGEPSTTLTLEGRLRGRTLTVPVPRLPQPTPFGEAILTRFSVKVASRSKGRGKRRRTYARTPSTCRGRWLTRAVFHYDDGRTTVKDSTPCRKPRRRR